MHVKTNDNVLVIAGKNRGKTGKVLRVFPDRNRAVVEGVNLVKRHMKQRTAGGPSGVIEREAPLHASNLMLLCPQCNRPTRIGHMIEGGKKLRVCKRCGTTLE